MWTIENRARYQRDHLRYPSDVTDEEWQLVALLISPAKRGGRKRTVDIREVLNAVMYILSSGCQWRALPKELPPRSTVFGYFDLWIYHGTLERIHQRLYEQCRAQAGRKAEPTAAIIDSQSVKRAEKGGRTSTCTGFDAGKLIKGKQRHLLVDTLGLLLVALVHSASIQDRDGGIMLLAKLAGRCPSLRKLFADSA
jgi:transposase